MLAASVGGPGIAGVGFHPQRAELDGLADILVEIDDAPGDLVESGEARLLVDDLLWPAARMTTSSPGCSVAGVPRHARAALGLALLPAAPRLRSSHGCGGATAMPGCGILRNDCGAGRRRQRLRLHRSGRRHALPRRRTVGVGSSRPRGSSGTAPRRRRAAAAALAARNSARAGAAPDRKRYCRSARAPVAQARSSRRPRGPQYRSGQWFETSRGFKRQIGLATSVQTYPPLAGASG